MPAAKLTVIIVVARSRYKGHMKTLDVLEDIVRGNPDFEPLVHAARYFWLLVQIKFAR
jgi:hypothetical protein